MINSVAVPPIIGWCKIRLAKVVCHFARVLSWKFMLNTSSQSPGTHQPQCPINLDDSSIDRVLSIHRKGRRRNSSNACSQKPLRSICFKFVRKTFQVLIFGLWYNSLKNADSTGIYASYCTRFRRTVLLCLVMWALALPHPAESTASASEPELRFQKSKFFSPGFASDPLNQKCVTIVKQQQASFFLKIIDNIVFFVAFFVKWSPLKLQRFQKIRHIVERLVWFYIVLFQ